MSAWFQACSVDDVDEDDVVGVNVNGKPYAVYRSEDGDFFASDGYCTHEEALLCDGLVMDGVIECPKHNGRFDYRSGHALGAPVVTNLRTYQTKVEGGNVLIGVDE